MSVDPHITKARAVAGKLREAWLRAKPSAVTAAVDRDDLDAAREALLTLSALLEAVDGAAIMRARDAMATAAYEQRKATLLAPAPTATPDDTDDKED